MRVGTNPAKIDPSVVSGYGAHRVVIPVYIPNQDGYFAHSLEVARLSLESLHLSSRGQTAVTVYCNGCSEEVTEEMCRLHALGWIDQLILDRENKGKVNVVLSVARGSYEPFITMADADILYLDGWMESVAQIFRAFPEAGYVSPIGVCRPNCRHTSATFLGAKAKGELSFQAVVSEENIVRHAESLGRPVFVDVNREGQFVVQRGDVTAGVGCGHQILTIRREVLESLPREPIVAFDKAEEDWIDKPQDVAGFWRLCVPSCPVSHMGNTPDNWIYEQINTLRQKAATEEPSNIQ